MITSGPSALERGDQLRERCELISIAPESSEPFRRAVREGQGAPAFGIALAFPMGLVLAVDPFDHLVVRHLRRALQPAVPVAHRTARLSDPDRGPRDTLFLEPGFFTVWERVVSTRST